MNPSQFIKSNLFKRYPQLIDCKTALEGAVELLCYSFKKKGKVLIMGNGGSSADAEHFCGELMKGFILSRKLNAKDAEVFDLIDPNLAKNLQYALPAISLGVGHSLISAFSNDMNWDYAFAQQIYGLGSPEDVVFGISTSGNSPNVVNGIKVAKSLKIKTITLTGPSESQCSQYSDVCIKTPGNCTHEIQELHLPIYHALALELENYFYGS